MLAYLEITEIHKKKKIVYSFSRVAFRLHKRINS